MPNEYYFFVFFISGFATAIAVFFLGTYIMWRIDKRRRDRQAGSR